MTDLEIAQAVTPRPILEVGAQLGIRAEELTCYGRDKAKVSPDILTRLNTAPKGHYVLVTAINPTPLGEGKTTTSIGLVMGLARLGHRAALTLRQPSLGPVFGVKGGGTGGGHAQVIPMEEINLHLTGDAHAVASSHNLLSAFVDNHLFHGNRLSIDPKRITWPRTLNVNDRALREIILGEGTVAHQGQFVITEASEIMAVLASYRSFIEAYKPQVGFIITNDLIATEQFGSTKVYFIPFESIDMMLNVIKTNVSIF